MNTSIRLWSNRSDVTESESKYWKETKMFIFLLIFSAWLGFCTSMTKWKTQCIIRWRKIFYRNIIIVSAAAGMKRTKNKTEKVRSNSCRERWRLTDLHSKEWKEHDEVVLCSWYLGWVDLLSPSTKDEKWMNLVFTIFNLLRRFVARTN